MRSMMSKLRLTVNETKTRLCRVPEESVNFLGYTIGRCHSPRTGRSYIGTTPSAKKIDSLKAEIHELTSRRWLWTTVEDRVAKLNRKLLGWSNYFCLGPSARPTEPSTATRGIGSASGFEGSTRCRVAGRHDSPTRGCMTNSASSACATALELSVGEGVSSCPRAGCGKSARPVR